MPISCICLYFQMDMVMEDMVEVDGVRMVLDLGTREVVMEMAMGVSFALARPITFDKLIRMFRCIHELQRFCSVS